MAGTGRYKAGTIFLDVAPSFDGVQEKIKRYVEKDSGLNDALEKQGQEAGEAFAKGEGEGYKKAAEKAGQARLKQGQAVNKAVIADAEKTFSQVVSAHKRADQQQTQVVEQGAKERGKLRRSEADEAKNLQKQVDFAHGEAIKERNQRERDAIKASDQAKRDAAKVDEGRLKDFGQFYRRRLREDGDLQTQMLAEEKAKRDAGVKENQDRLNELGRQNREYAKKHGDLLTQMHRDEELANAMHDGAIRARAARRLAEEKADSEARKQLAKEEADERERYDRALMYRYKAIADEQAALDKGRVKDREKAHQMALDEEVRREKGAAKEREQIVSASGGRIGRLIRKAVGNAVEDLPVVKIDADSSNADRVVAGVRSRLIALRDAKIGVDIDSKKALGEIATLQAMLRTVARNHDGSININSMAALASLQAVENKINSIQREAKKPILLRVRTMMGGGDRGGIGADGANAFRAFNVAVLAVASALALLGPLVTVAAAGIATLAGAAIAGGAGLGVLALGFHGVFQAIGDQIKAEDDLAKQSDTSAKQRANSAKQVRDAKQRLADAEQNAARSTADAARQVADAERGVTRARKEAARGIQEALRAEQDAQRALVDARRQAAEGVANAIQQEKDAQRNLADARKAAAQSVLDALEAEKDAQRNLADARRQAAESVRSAIEQEEQAQRSLADTRRQVARDVESAIEQQASAERRLEDAQRSATNAQRDLTQARREARREIEDLSMSYRQSQLAEAEAAVAITQSQERLNEVRRRAAKGDASAADVRQAQIDVQQARLRAEEMRTRRRRAGADSARATRAGVEGSDRVQNAKERLRSAEQNVVDSQKALAKASKAIAEARTKGARQVADAERAVAKASQATARARVDAARKVADAERAAAKASANVAKAREDGGRRVSDAELALAAASAGVTKARRDGARQISDAERAVADAARNTADARTSGAERIADAERTLADAQRAQRRTAEDNAKAIQQAQQAVSDAQSAAAEAANAQSAAARNAALSMAALSPAGQRFARFILGLRGEFNKLRDIAQEGMLPGLEAGMRELGIYKSGFRRFVGDMSKMWGDLFASFGQQLTNDTWKSFFATMGRDAPEQTRLLSQAMFNVLETIAALTDAFSPLTTEMLTWLEQATSGWADWAANLKGSPGFERFLDYVREVAPIVKDFLLALGRAIIAVGVALAPFAEGFMKVLTEAFDYIAGMDPKILGFIATGLIAIVIAFQLGNGAVALFTSLMNPLASKLSLWVTLITIVALGLIYLYQTNDTARKYIDKFLGALKAVGGYMLEHIGVIAKLVWAFASMFLIYKIVMALKALRKAQLLTIVTTKLLAAAQKAAFLLNPWVLAIAALVAVIIYLWKTNESFRDVVKAVWAAVKRAMAAVVDWFRDVAAPAMGRVFDWLGKNVLPVLATAMRWLGKVITWVWESVILPYLRHSLKVWRAVFRAMAAAGKWMWENVLKPAFAEMNKWWRDIIAPTLRWLYNKVIKPVFRGAAALAKWMWQKVIKPAFRGMWSFIKNTLGPSMRWLYNKVAKPVLRGIAAVAKWMWFKVIKPAFRGMRNFIKNVLGPAFSWLWKKVVKPVAGWIGRRVKWMWEKVVRPALRAMRNFIKNTLGPAFSWLWKKIIKPVTKWIWNRIKDLWNKAIKPAFRAIRNFIKDKLGPAFSWLWKKGVRPALNNIREKIEWLRKKARNSFDKIKTGVDAVRKAFGKARDGIKKIWDKLSGIIEKPINKALKFIQKNFIDKINGLLKKAGLDLSLPRVWGGGSKASGTRDARSRSGGLQQHAEGGKVRGPWRGATADNVLGISTAGVPTAWVNPKEYVTKVSSTEKMERRHPGVLDYINKHGTLPTFSTGGRLDLPHFAKGGAVYKSMAAWVRKHLPGVAITSAYRPGAITATGNKSNHGKGRALDLAPSMKTFNKILKAFGGSKILELIYSPAGGRQISKGRRYNYPQPTRGDHWDHVHWAMASMKGGGFGGAGGLFFDAVTQKALDWITKKGKGVIDKIPGKNIFTKMSKALLKKSLDGLKSKVEEEGGIAEGGDPSGAPGGAGVKRWAATVRKALKIMNQPLSLTNTVLRRMSQESGGNARAINNWDSNAKRGTPSKGLMQVIGPTFRSFRHPKYSSNIYNPLANILASMRYAIRTYGSLSRAYNRKGGYARGTDRATAGWHLVGEEGPELMRFRGGEQVYNRNQTMRLAELAGKGGQGGGGVSKVYVQNPWTGEYHEARMREVVEDHSEFEKSVGRMRR